MRVAVLGAGGPAGVSALRALRAAGHECIAADADARHLVWCESLAETVHMPEITVRAVNDLGADVVIPQPDTVTAYLARLEVEPATLLPSWQVIETCQDKSCTARRWYNDELRTHPPEEIGEPWPDYLHLAADRFGLPFWLRATKGAGAKGAILVRSLEQAFHWIRFWQSRGQNWEWVAEEHLPGRDFAWSSVWFKGDLQASFARERLEYLYPHLTPEGLTGTPTIARVVHDDRVNAVARAAVLAIDAEPHGIYSVDLKEDANGHPRPTEINAGRGFTTFGLWSLYGPNFLDLVARLAWHGKGWWLSRPDLNPPDRWNALPDGLTLQRHIDCGHVFVRKPFAEARRQPLARCA